MQGTCTGCCGGGPPNWSSRTIGVRIVESLWEGKRGRAKQAGGVEEAEEAQRGWAEASVFAERWGNR